MRWTLTGTHLGQVSTGPPTGTAITHVGMASFRPELIMYRRRELMDLVFTVGFFALTVLYAGAALRRRFGHVPPGRRGMVWSEAQGWAFAVSMGLYGASRLVGGWSSTILLVAAVLVFCFGLYLIRRIIRQGA